MPMGKKINFTDLVNYIIMPPNHNINQTAEHFGLCRDTVAKYLKRLSIEGDEYFDLAKAKLVNDTLERLLAESRAKSGSKSHRPFIFNTANALKFRYMNVYLGVSTREIAKLYGCSHMTIHNAIKNLDEKAIATQDEEIKRIMEQQNSEEQAVGDLENKWMR